MNYLAHLVLSGTESDMQVGGFLGDWLKGSIESHQSRWPAGVIQGVQLHRQIDAWIDRQPETRAAMYLLSPRYRRFAGPVIDIAFDHFLARHFIRFHEQQLAEFCRLAFLHLDRYKHKMPEGAQQFLRHAQDHRLFERYAERETLLRVVASLGKRISRPELLAGVEHKLVEGYAQLEQIFEVIYPKLMVFGEASRASIPFKAGDAHG